jgi:putative addiction module component (TIGR02574 family)
MNIFFCHSRAGGNPDFARRPGESREPGIIRNGLFHLASLGLKIFFRLCNISLPLFPLPLFLFFSAKSCGTLTFKLWRCFMRSIKDLIQEAAALPIEERIILVDSLLRTLNVPNPDIDAEWIGVAKRRLAELRTGRVNPIPGDQVFARIRERFGR